MPSSPPSPPPVMMMMSAKGASLHFMRMFAVLWADGYLRLSPPQLVEESFPCRSLTERVRMLGMLNEGLDAIRQKRQVFIQTDVSDLTLASLVTYALYVRYKYDFTKRMRVRQLLALWSGMRSESAFNQLFSSRSHFLPCPSGEWLSEFDSELKKAHDKVCLKNAWKGMSNSQKAIHWIKKTLQKKKKGEEKEKKTKLSYLAYYLEKRALVCAIEPGHQQHITDPEFLVELPKMWPFPLSAKRLLDEGGGDRLITPVAITSSSLFIFH